MRRARTVIAPPVFARASHTRSFADVTVTPLEAAHGRAQNTYDHLRALLA